MKLTMLYEGKPSTWKSKLGGLGLAVALGAPGVAAKMAADKFDAPQKREFPAEVSPDPRVLEPKPEDQPTPETKPAPETQPAVAPEKNNRKYLETIFGDELDTIEVAAVRNGVVPPNDLFYILLAIRKAENGGPGTEFGVMDVANTNLDRQAGWAAATVYKNYERWREAKANSKTADDFITFLGKRYAPRGVENDPTNLNRHWIDNVKHWFKKLKASK